MNQNFGTTGIKHAVAMLLMMALEDENHQHLNINYVSSQATPPEVSIGAEAKWLRDLILVGASGPELRRRAIDEGMITLRQSGLTKVKQGVTTMEEVVRETVK